MPEHTAILILAALLTIAMPAGFGGFHCATMVTSSDDAEGVQGGPRWGFLKYLNEETDTEYTKKNETVLRKTKLSGGRRS